MKPATLLQQKRQPLESSPDYETTDLAQKKIAYDNTSNHNSIHNLGKSKSLRPKFILTGRGCQIQHPKNLAQYIDYVVFIM